MKKVIAFLFLSVAWAQPQGRVQQVSLETANRSYHPSRVIVRFRSGAQFLPGSGASHALGGNNIHLVDNPPGLFVAETIRLYQANPNVVYAEPDYYVHTTSTPTDPLWSNQWDMVKINAPGAWNTQTNASDVIVAVIDTGVDFTHPDLQANLWVNTDGSHGFTCLNGTCAHDGQDDYGHGTHVAGTIGAVANNATGIAGINWSTKILSCKFLGSSGSGSTSDAVLCFNQILALKQQGYNIRVTSNSWGGGGYNQALKDAMLAVESVGILNVCAAGNSGVNLDLAPMYPGAFDNRGIVSVLASDQNDAGASFTNYGIANVDIAAPGVNTLSTVPTSACSLCDPSGYRLLSGTSMATPHVSGVAVALFHLNSALTAAQARDVLLDPASYDIVTDSLGSMTSTGGRLNFQKAISNPLVYAPKLNNFPTVTVSNVTANAGQTVNLTATASDPDNDTVRMQWSRQDAPWLFGFMLKSILPASGTSFQAPTVARTALAPYSVSVADGRGGGATAPAYVTVQPVASPGPPPSGVLTVSPTSGPVGTTVTVNYPVTAPAGQSVAWELWTTATTASGSCCVSAGSTSFPINTAGAYRISTQAMDSELNLSNRQSAVVRIGGATGTPPLIGAMIDKLSGPAPLSVNIDMTGTTATGGTITSYSIACQYGGNGVFVAGPKGACTYDTPGTYWILLQVQDSNGLSDAMSAYVVVTPAGSGSSKQTATVTLSNLTQDYTSSPLTPTATTNPPGLNVVWTNAPQTNAGTYSVTATVNDPNYQGSATGAFTIAKQAATINLSNLTQTYTGSPLTPSATTDPSGLAIVWTNAAQTNAGTYSVTATVNDPNSQGSASGTFTINKATASVSLSNLTQRFTGNALAPTAATTPSGLAIGWTNAPQVNPGSYAVVATVNTPNYQGSNNGTFTIMPAGSTPPSATITSPASGATVTVKSSVTIQASATAGSNPLARVDFLLNGAVICSATGAPYSCPWNVPAAAGKSYQLQANAYDSTGQVGTSATVSIKSSR